MKKIFLIILTTTLLSSLAEAQTEKISHCPSVDQIKIIRVSKPWTHYYSAYNNDNNYFYSKEYVEDEHNGPAPPINLQPDLSSYDAKTKTLWCVYYAYTREENIYPTLINVGDY